MAIILPYDGIRPRIARDAFLAPSAVIIGNVRIGSEASVWFGAVLRGDEPEHEIAVGPRSSVQDNCVIHVGARGPTRIGREVTVGHGAVFESCEIRDRALIGMNTVILQRAVIGEEAVVAALSVVLEGTEVPPRMLVAGSPARVRKELMGSAANWIRRSADHYVKLSRSYLSQGIGTVPREWWPESGDDGAR
ncbi:MAG: gamma carbonic anhydrase family protein [Gemmatimonadetes bacterium]|nr:gamma carbonic anhydrase family protein [Gemmatimonadota bacterium]